MRRSSLDLAGRGWRAVALASCVLAFALRSANLDKQSLWWDEAFSVIVARKSISQILNALETYPDFNPPLHYLVLHFWVPLAGQFEFAARWPSVAAGTLMVAAAAILARRLFGPGGAMFAAILFALHPFLVYYGQEARTYALTAFLVPLALYWALRAWKNASWLAWGAFAVVATAALYNYYYSILLLLAIPPALVLAGPAAIRSPTTRVSSAQGRRLFQLALAGLLVLVLYVPWLPSLISVQARWDPPPLAELAPWQIVPISWPFVVMGLPGRVAADSALLIALQVVVGIGVVAGCVLALGRSTLSVSLRYCVVAFLLPIIGIMAIAYLNPGFHPRHVILAAGPLYLMFAGLAAWRTAGSRMPTGLVLALPALVAGLYGLSQIWTEPRLIRDDYRAVIAYVSEHEQPGDVILTNTSTSISDPSLAYYYGGDASIHGLKLLPYRESEIATQLEQLTEGSSRAWYLRHIQRPTDPEELVLKQLTANGRLIANPRWSDLDLFLFELFPSRDFSVTSFSTANGSFGEILEITGISLPTDPVAGGDSLIFSTRWKVLRTPESNLGVWSELADDSGISWGREDRRPSNERVELSSNWVAGQEVVVRHQLPVLPGTPPGAYRLKVAVYDLVTLAGLEAHDANGNPLGRELELAKVTIAPTFEPVNLEGYGTRPVDADAGGIQLLAAGLRPTAIRSGERLTVDTLWRSNAAHPTAPAPKIRIIREDGGVEFERAIRPVYPPSEWLEGQYVRLRSEVSLAADAPAGRYLAVIPLADGRVVELGEVSLEDVQRVFEAPNVAKPIVATLGDVAQLIGFELEPAEPRAGGQISLRLIWRALEPTSISYRVFVHVAGPDLRPQAQADAEPQQRQRPTSGWWPNEYIDDRYLISLPADLPAGQYQILVGMYDPITQRRLPADGADAAGDFVRVTTVQVR